MPRKKQQPSEPEVLEIDGIPTAAGLVARGKQYAYRTQRGIHITAEGHALLGKLLRDRGRDEKAKGTWHGITGKHPGKPRQPGL